MLTVEEKLDNALDIESTSKVLPVKNVTPKYESNNSSEVDFQYSRENLYGIIERGSDAMESLLQIAQETEHPRAYEVLGQLIDKLTNANKELVNLHKQVKDIKAETNKTPQNVTNALFVGSTADLQKMLKDVTKDKG